jgi:hypothetical protein
MWEKVWFLLGGSNQQNSRQASAALNNILMIVVPEHRLGACKFDDDAIMSQFGQNLRSFHGLVIFGDDFRLFLNEN